MPDPTALTVSDDFHVFVRPFDRMINALARELSPNNREVRAELVQEGMTAIWLARETWRNGGGMAFKPYAEVKARQAMRDYMRRERRHIHLVDAPEVDEVSGWGRDASDLVAAQEGMVADELAHQALIGQASALPDREARIYLARVEASVSYREIAAAEGVSKSVVVKLFKRAVRRIGLALAPPPPTEVVVDLAVLVPSKAA